jgi:hypothetical protein
MKIFALVLSFFILSCRSAPDISGGEWACKVEGDCLKGYFCDMTVKKCKKKETTDIASDMVSDLIMKDIPDIEYAENDGTDTQPVEDAEEITGTEDISANEDIAASDDIPANDFLTEITDISVTDTMTDVVEISDTAKGFILTGYKINCSTVKCESSNFRLKSRLCPVLFSGESANGKNILKSKFALP